jgi:hypothetical protein
MKNFCFILLFFCSVFATNGQIINFADANFKNVLLQANSDTGEQRAGGGNGGYFIIDANHDNEIDVDEALQVTYLNIHTDLVTSLSGIEYFNNLQTFLLWNNNQYSHTDIDIHALSHLTQFLYACGNQTATLNVTGLANLTDLTVRGALLPSLDLHGLTSLQSLYLTQNCGLTSIDITPAANLAYMTLLGNPLTSIYLNGNPNLRHVWISGSSITTIDVSALPLLTNLNVDDNQITSLNLLGADNLEYLVCSKNQLTSLNVSANPHILDLRCEKNQLTEIDLSNNTVLSNFTCTENQITYLDLSHSTFRNIFCGSNNLVSLNIKNNNYDCEVHYNQGQTYGRLIFDNNPNLTYICADPIETAYVQGKLAQYGYTNCVINSYCSFNPGGDFYTISGSSKIDFDANGCDQNDSLFPNLKYSITDGMASGNLIPDTSGNYSISVQEGTHTLTPIFENPDYFFVSPANASIIFPAETSPFAQNFCITPNGIHSDLEVNIIPISSARPGFDAIYKIVYKNKGNQVQSGTVSLAYNDAVVDFINSSVAPSSQPMNYINWNFTNLQPLESKEIIVTFNINSPLETPPVNSGFNLLYTLCINGGVVDETPEDNIFVLHQTVVNSFDPNNKICLEGNAIGPEMIGKYVHYVINFENTGTANAENIVLKDVIDTTKFDISSLVPIDGSHPYVTKISDGSKVEFIFENINLPFDDEHNDGYLAFKIKTKPDLSIGDSISNSASIYFDYNAPIDTEPVVTTIRTLTNSDFMLNNVFSIFPNPAASIIQISNLSNEEFEIQITSMLGKVLVQESNSDTIDVSNLARGIYLVTIHQGDRTLTQKLIKN